MEIRLSGKQRENKNKPQRIRKGIMITLKDLNLVGYSFFVCVPASSALSTTVFGEVSLSRSSSARAQAQELELDHLYH